MVEENVILHFYTRFNFGIPSGDSFKVASKSCLDQPVGLWKLERALGGLLVKVDVASSEIDYKVIRFWWQGMIHCAISGVYHVAADSSKTCCQRQFRD